MDIEIFHMKLLQLAEVSEHVAYLDSLLPTSRALQEKRIIERNALIAELVNAFSEEKV